MSIPCPLHTSSDHHGGLAASTALAAMSSSCPCHFLLHSSQRFLNFVREKRILTPLTMPPIGKQGGLVIPCLPTPQLHSPGSSDPRSLTLEDFTWAPSPRTSCWLQPMGDTGRLEGGRGQVGTFLPLAALGSGLRVCQLLPPYMTPAPARPSY